MAGRTNARPLPNDATAVATDILSGKTAYSGNPMALVTGAIVSKSAATYTPTTSNQTIAAGQYLSGAQTILGDADLIAGNIKSGISIFGVNGSLSLSSFEPGNVYFYGNSDSGVPAFSMTNLLIQNNDAAWVKTAIPSAAYGTHNLESYVAIPVAQGNTADVGVIYLNIFSSGAAEDVSSTIEDDGVGFVGARAILVNKTINSRTVIIAWAIAALD